MSPYPPIPAATGISMELPIAQLDDIGIPGWVWIVFITAGFLAPSIGLLVSVRFYGMRRRGATCVGIFYMIALPLGGFVFLWQVDNPLTACLILLLVPVGIALGVAVLIPFEQIGTKGQVTGMDQKSSPRRRPFQFSLRTMLIVMVLASAAFGWWVHRSKEWIRQRHEALECDESRIYHRRAFIRVRAPSGLWIFGEKGFAELGCLDDMDASQRETLQRLFPESRIHH
jgi:hypothetical protein